MPWLTARSMTYLPKHLHIVCVDMPGHEGTTRTNKEDYSILGQVRRIHQFVETLRLNRKPFHVIGTSMGGNVAGVYAATYSSEICSMTLICPDGIKHPCESKFDNHLQDLERSNFTLNIPLIPTTPEEMEDMFKLCSHVRFKIPQQILQGLVDVRQPHNSFYEEVFMEIVDEKSRYALQEHLHLITAPLQVIWGKQDQVVDVSGAAVIADILPACRVDLLENCGHSVVMERPCRTAKLILDFIILQQDARGESRPTTSAALCFGSGQVCISLQMDNGDWGHRMTTPVTLNVGGHLYTTSLSTLQRYPDSMLGAMFRGDFPTTRDSQGNYFIDRDGTLFRYILNFLRTSELTLPVDFTETDLLRKEADFYQIEPLIHCLSDPKPLYPPDIFEQVVELSSTRKLSKYSNPVAVIITQLTITTKVHALLEGISNNFTKWNKHMMDTRDCQVSFTFGPCDYHQEVSLRVHLMDYIMKQGFTIRNTRVHHMSERANENTVEHHWTFCRPAHIVED
ncbi:BTB/POZ domain-containing protein KCTD6 isoform X3 [Dunckerocampus dactyliophorus]|nr:BTB/POZ domain-containing protein KCTD6 isoform X3 [Dunckerocampus dactyliophorus]